MYEVVRVGDEGLMGEVIELHGDQSVIQVYEETSGISPGEPVIRTGQTLSVQLGPGLLTQIYDGIQRPLADLEAKMGVFIERGVAADGLDMAKMWDFNATVAVGDEVAAGAILGTVQETETIEHRVMLPPGKSGVIKSIESGEFNVTQTVWTLEDGTAIAMLQEWPVRTPRPFVQKYAPNVPLITGQRILDFLFPLAKGGTAAIPGPFGRGKTGIPQELA
jgi:V/A-type H+-transporting ATPase subunit A